MAAVCIALLPAAVMSCVIFGINALIILVTCVISCVLFEGLFRVITKKTQTIGDLSAVVTGLILAMNLPSSVPIYIPILGSFFAIVIVKQLFGGIGQNFANPAITARVFLMISFSAQMTKWTIPVTNFTQLDAVTAPTPLAADFLISGTDKVLPFTLKDMLTGFTGGCLGETCAIALLLGGLILIFTKTITPTIPLVYIGTVGIFTLIYTQSLAATLYYLLGGGLLLGAIFMATDYATSPLTEKGKIIFAFGCGALTFLIRHFAGFPEGVSFSILIMNLLTPMIDRFTASRPIGIITEKKEAVK
jgi:electron transport complex protein RnfD